MCNRIKLPRRAVQAIGARFTPDQLVRSSVGLICRKIEIMPNPRIAICGGGKGERALCRNGRASLIDRVSLAQRLLFSSRSPLLPLPPPYSLPSVYLTITNPAHLSKADGIEPSIHPPFSRRPAATTALHRGITEYCAFLLVCSQRTERASFSRASRPS